ncbi:MAG: MmgE/PrpD family protein [Hyphomicrobiaceae bacterium]|nr:MmgE/PrpD family protein [Hyphomicrobiaceae bacterium]
MSTASSTVEALLAVRAIAAFRQPPQELFDAAARSMADCAGVAIAGADELPVRRMADSLDVGAANRNVARVLPNGRVLPWRSAAVVNGMAAHFHDFDDDDPVASVGHPSVTSLAAGLAAADALDRPGADLLAAYICGVETTMRIGLMVNPKHYNAGWHATATLGLFGATVASGLLMGLREDELANALGIAASFCSGIKSNFGSDLKPLQVGHAAGNGLWAAELSQRGVKSAPASLFGDRGLLAAVGAGPVDRDLIAAFGKPWCLASPGVNIKLYPCCSSSHTAIDGILELMQEHALSAGDLARIDIWVGKDVPQILIYDVPRTGLEGKFSLRYSVAAAAFSRGPTLADFTDAALHRPGLPELVERTRQHIDAEFAPCGGSGVTHQARVRIETTAGLVAERTVHDPLGSAARPVSEGRLREKFISCVGTALGIPRAHEAFTTWMSPAAAPSARRLVDALGRA